jgi:hypothetical protein
MNSADLKQLQAPLKKKYKSQPESAIITLKAEGKIGKGYLVKWERPGNGKSRA